MSKTTADNAPTQVTSMPNGGKEATFILSSEKQSFSNPDGSVFEATVTHAIHVIKQKDGNVRLMSVDASYLPDGQLMQSREQGVSLEYSKAKGTAVEQQYYDAVNGAIARVFADSKFSKDEAQNLEKLKLYMQAANVDMHVDDIESQIVRDAANNVAKVPQR